MICKTLSVIGQLMDKLKINKKNKEIQKFNFSFFCAIFFLFNERKMYLDFKSKYQLINNLST